MIMTTETSDHTTKAMDMLKENITVWCKVVLATAADSSPLTWAQYHEAVLCFLGIDSEELPTQPFQAHEHLMFFLDDDQCDACFSAITDCWDNHLAHRQGLLELPSSRASTSV